MKTVHIHIGPHKTGSTALQNYFRQHQSFLLDDLNLCFLSHQSIHSASMAMCKDLYEEAKIHLAVVKAKIKESKKSHFLLSSEDFCGDYVGRRSTRRVYPKLTKNLRTLERELAPFKVVFYFFDRDISEWARSVYAQGLRYHQSYSSFEQFSRQCRIPENWDEITHKVQEYFGPQFVSIEYEKNGTDIHQKLLTEIVSTPSNLQNLPAMDRVNETLSKPILQLFEVINHTGCSSKSSQAAKRHIEQDASQLVDHDKRVSTQIVPSSEDARLQWPPSLPLGPSGEVRLFGLHERATNRIHKQFQNCILPNVDEDFSRFRLRVLDDQVSMPTVSRSQIENQAKILQYHFRGGSYLGYLNALVISYLRRDTPHTKIARNIFHRLWEEEYIILLSTLPTRWLISTMQTFADHGQSESLKLVGASSFFYANMIKIYEAERALEGQEPNAIYAHNEPSTKGGFRGLDRFKLGGSDILVNTNAYLYELACGEPVAGRVVEEFMLRVKNSNSVFSRMDKSRKENGVTIPNFEDTWSFFVEP